MTDSSVQTIAATFDGRGEAQRAADMLTKNLSHSRVKLRSRRSDEHVQYAEMRDELEGVVASPALGTAMTRSQTEGGFGGALVVGGIAALLGVLVGFMVNGAPGSEISVVRWLITWVLVPAFAGGTLGLLAGGLLKSRYAPAPEDEAPPREASSRAGLEDADETVVEVSVNEDSELHEAEDILAQMAPMRLDLFNAHGEVVSTKDLGNRASG